MVAVHLRFPSAVHLELNLIGVNDAVFDVTPVVEVKRLPLERVVSVR